MLTNRLQNAEDTLGLVASAIVTDEYKRSANDWVFERRILNHLKICEENISKYFSGSKSKKVAEASFAIASAYLELGRYRQAKLLCQRAIDGYETVDRPSYLDAIDRMGSILYLNKQDHEAQSMYRKALAGKEKVFGSEDPSTLETMNNLANVLGDQGQSDKALELYRKSLAGKEKALGENHRSTLQTVHGIATIFDSNGHYDEALEWYQ
ncbi:hypothetical protein RUND412_002265 [Rhizina undulata]